MSKVNRSIVSLLDPNIQVESLSYPTYNYDETDENYTDTTPKNENIQGELYPFIKINTITIDKDNILNFNLSLRGKIPTVSITIDDRENLFVKNFPKDGDLISIYIKPSDVDNLRPIRIDFDILNIYSSNHIYDIYGTMHIKNLYDRILKSYDIDTSFNHLLEISESLNIGFATNESFTDDEMIRISPNKTYIDFIDDIVESAYKDDDSFFDWFIDPYYYLNFVNINNQFILNIDEHDDVNISATKLLNSSYTSSNTVRSGKLFLTNLKEFEELDTYIETYSLENNSGSIWSNDGYKRFAQWYNILNGEDDTFENQYVEPLNTKNSESDFIILRGKAGDDSYKTLNTHSYLGKQDSIDFDGNMHNNYQYSKILNHQNLIEINKIKLHITLPKCNMYIYKYMSIPVYIYSDGIEHIKNELHDELINHNKSNVLDDINVEDRYLDEFISGVYVINEIEYIYNGGRMTQKLTLIKREFTPPILNI